MNAPYSHFDFAEAGAGSVQPLSDKSDGQDRLLIDLIGDSHWRINREKSDRVIIISGSQICNCMTLQ